MNRDPLTCPYCNAQVSATGLANAPGRIPCPRCGETFPYRPAETGAGTTAPPPSPQDAPSLLESTPAHLAVQLGVLSALSVGVSLVLRFAVASDITHRAFPFMFLLGAVGATASAWLWYFRRPRSNGAAAFFILGNMLAVAVLVLPFALATTDFRRARDPSPKGGLKQSPDGTGAADARASAAELPALGWLPEDSNLLVGIHVAEVLREPAGKEFLEQPSWGPLRAALTQVEKWTGLKKEAIDHVALGVRTRQLLPRLTIVVQTHDRYDPAAFKLVLDESKPMNHQGRLLYPLQIKPVGEGALWCVGERTLLLTLWWDGARFEEVRKGLPLAPRPPLQGLSPALRTCLEKRLPQGTPIWVAGESIPPQMLAAILPFTRGVKGLPAPLAKVKAFDIGVRFYSDRREVGLLGDLECADREAAVALQKFLEGRSLPEVGAAKVVGPGDAGPWVSFQLRGDPEKLRRALKSGNPLLPR